MATIGSLALAIRARTERLKTDLKPALDEIARLGEVMKASGMEAKEVERHMGRMRAEAVRGAGGAQQHADATEAFGQRLRNAKTAAAALTGAISAMSSEVGGAVGHVTRLGTSLTASFLAGGPGALGATALAAGIAAIADASREAERAAEETAKAQKRWFEDQERQAVQVRDRVLELRDAVRAAALGAPGLASGIGAERRQAEEFTKDLEQQEEIRRRIAKLQEVLVSKERDLAALAGTRTPTPMVRQSQKYVDAARAAVEAEKENLRVVQERLATRQEEAKLQNELAAETVKADREEAERSRMAATGVAAMELRAQNLRREVEDLETARSLEADRTRMIQEGALAARARASQLQGVIAKQDAQMRQQAEEARDAAFKDSDARLLGLGRHLKQKAQERARDREDATRRSQALARELQDLQASNRFELDRLRIKRELVDRMREANGSQREAALAAQVAQEKLSQLAAEEAHAAKEAADAAREKAQLAAAATAELARQKSLLKEQADITKRFANFGGSSPFGFGRGAVGTGMGMVGMAAQRRTVKGAPQGGGQGGGGQGGGFNLPDLTPQLKEIEAEISKIPPWYERLASAVTSVNAGTKRAVTELGKSTQKAVAALRQDQNELEVEVRSLAKAIERAGSGTGGGD